MAERIQKVLAQHGYGSRREIERWITEGKLSVNGKRCKLGHTLIATDKVRLEGQLLSLPFSDNATTTRVLMYNKPEGELCSRQTEENRPTVFERLPPIHQQRWIMVGRLDLNTSGLLLFTNDGELANRLMHPKHEIVREYAVRVFGDVNKQMIDRLQQGVALDDGIAQFLQIKPIPAPEEVTNRWFHVTLKEGRNREVRRLWESQGVKVSRLIRIRYGDMELVKNLPQGTWIELNGEQVNRLRNSVAMEAQNATQQQIANSEKLSHKDIQRLKRVAKKRKSGDIVFSGNSEDSRAIRRTKESATADTPRRKSTRRHRAPVKTRSGTR